MALTITRAEEPRAMTSPMPAAVDTVVIGNGVLGLSVAVRLARNGQQVAVVGPRDRRWAASAAAGAMHGCFGEVTEKLLSNDYGRAKFALDLRAAGMWDQWLAELSDLSGLHDDPRTSNGTIVLLNAVGTAELDSANYRAIVAALDEAKEPYESVQVEDIDWISPEPQSRPLQAVYVPGERSIDAARLLKMLEQALLSAGGSLIDDLVSVIDANDSQITGVVLRSGERIRADSVVCAAGARSAELAAGLPQLDDRLVPIVSGYGVSALVKTEDGRLPSVVLRTPNRAFACGLHAVPRMSGELYLGATNIISAHPRTRAALGDLQFLLDCATTQLHTGLAEAGLSAVQVGNRPVPMDGFPLIGSASLPGLSFLTGTYRDGLHQSPLLSEAVASQVQGGTSIDPDLVMFNPVRAPLQALSRDVTIETTVAHMLATGVEHAWRLPAEWPPRIERHLRRWYAGQVERWHPSFTPPPELVAAMQPEIEARLLRYYQAWS